MDTETARTLAKIPSVPNGDVASIQDADIGLVDKVDDKEHREFYGGSLTTRYRLKSELVSKCMEEIGMGRYQWELFVVTGFGWITDNL